MSSYAVRSLAGCRLLAVDLGPRYTGLAVRTSRLEGARPYGLLERVRRRRALSAHAADDEWSWALERERGYGGGHVRFASQAAALERVMDEQRVAAAVVGMPYYADGSYSPECAAVERRVAELQAAWTRTVPVLFWDERWSTQAAVGPRRDRPRDARTSHARAASVVLWEVLEALHPFEVAECEDADVAPLKERLEARCRAGT